ncbi:MAG: hypothetical protein JWN93_1697, partial [Hyphomicrobiales bacterium]|nr:hypothetical protein [Hyphomicrobiales bacterium]
NAPGKLGGADPVFGGGAEIGYNHQFGFAVIGAAADFTWLGKAKTSSWASTGGFSGTANEPLCESSGGASQLCSYGISGTATSTGSVQASAQWISTLRLKAGVAMDRLMVYGTGGLAFGKVKMNSQSTWTDSVTATCNSDGNTEGGGCEIPGAVGFGSSAAWQGAMSKTMTGYAVGGGVEYAATDNWLLKLEGLYYNLGTARMTVDGVGSSYAYLDGGPSGSPPPPSAVASYTVQKEIRGVIGKFGVSYKFATN